MKKFLSIFTLACLLVLGMALPAAAEEGTLPTLYVQVVGETGRYDNGVTVPTDIVRVVKFYIDGDNTEVEARPEVADSSIASVTKTGEGYEIQGLAQGETTITMYDDNGAITCPFIINVPQSSLKVSLDGGGSWQPTVENLSTEVSYPVRFRFGAESSKGAGSEGVFIDCDLKDITVEPASGLSLRNGEMIASKLGQYTLNYRGYTADVFVAYQRSADITVDELEYLKKSQSEFLDFLKTKGYSGTGSFTLRLPTGNLGNVECNVQLPNVAVLTLKGESTANTIMERLTIDGGNIIVDSIHFTGAPGIDVKDVAECTVSNCKFDKLPFQIRSSETNRAPRLVLTANVYTRSEFVTVLDSLGQEVGTWLASPKSKPETAHLDLDVNIGEYTANSKIQAFNFYVDSSVNEVLAEGWDLKFKLPCDFESAYAAYEGEKSDGEFESDTVRKYYKVFISRIGQYFVINGSYPELKNNEVKLSVADSILKKITVDTNFSGAIVTHNGVQVPAFINNKKLTFYTTEKNGAGTYKVTATTAATTTKTTKTTTTSRTYKYTYQDFYQVTPAGFTNAMRYVKDNLVTLNCTEAGRRSISLPVASMAAAAEKGYSVLVKTKNAELTLDAAALKSIAQQAKGTTVLLHYKSLNHKTLTTVGQASIQSHLDQFPGDNADLAFLVTATSDSETIEDLQMGAITLKIPFIILPGTEGMPNTVYALQSESIAEARETTVADGCLTTKLLDLTEHMVFLSGGAAQPTEEVTEPTEETTEATTVETTQPETMPETTQTEPPAETETKGGNLLLTVVIGLGIFLVIIAGVLAFILLRRRFRK